MYLTAQRVFSRTRDRDGVNAFLYEHGAASLPGPPDLERIATLTPGRLVAQEIAVAPGGNDVLSFLDAAAADEMSAERLLAAVRDRRVQLLTEGRVAEPDLALRFQVVPGLRGHEGVELDALIGAAQALVSRRHAPAARAPLEILVTPSDRGYSVALSADAAERVVQRRGTFQLFSIHVDATTHHDFLATHADLLPELALVLTGLDPPQILSEGGVRFTNTQTRTVLRTWPDRPDTQR